MYSPSYLANMLTKRGCFSAIYLQGYVFSFGGLNYTDKILKKSEKYDLKSNRWLKIACMIEPRKNSSACSLTSDTIYVFGGTSNRKASDTIEQYSVASDTWTLLKIRLPNPISFLVSFKINETKILLLGGSVKENSKSSKTYKTNQVVLFDVMKPEFVRCENMAKDVLSLYPAFYDTGHLFMVDEDDSCENPLVVKYGLGRLGY